MRDREVATSSGSRLMWGTGGGSLWSAIWRAKVPPRVRVFMWKLCVGALPTLSNLARYGGGLDSACVSCGGHPKTAYHTLLECPMARQVWALSYIPWQWVSRWEDDAAGWIFSVVQRLRRSDREWFFIIC
ncbi:UNVERIFIED_CONTAM: hypothetical protein Sradi_1774700 [Sesamum radiatum]|uniref:Reverse transcriptase zinc-binding domain-containing protein n=1 Tax=Sesamum radiatum TaxID=300843 RepID=A0AAW2TTS1_SESRA